MITINIDPTKVEIGSYRLASKEAEVNTDIASALLELSNHIRGGGKLPYTLKDYEGNDIGVAYNE